MDTKSEFDKAAEIVKNNAADLSKKTDDERLEIYALFKQATVGDANTPEPGMFHVKDKAKWKAWQKKAGMPKEKAMQEYVDLAKKYLPSKF